MGIGVSSDSPESHRLFKEKYNLPLILHSDTHDIVRKLFGVDVLYTGKSPGRVTFVIDKNGVVQYVFDSASDIDKHIFSTQRVLIDLKKQNQSLNN